MIYFVIRVLVNGLALALTMILAPGLNLLPLLPGVVDVTATYLLFGILFGVINALVRPLVLLLTARLLVRTMGWFAIVINAFLFSLLAWIAPKAFVVESPRLLWIVIGGSLMAIVVVVMEAFFGLDKPEFRNKTESQIYWRWVGMLSSGRRNTIAENLRIAQISEISSRYLKDIVVDMTPLARFRVFMQELLFRSVDPVQSLTLPEKVRYMLQELGPTFVKFGQIVSSRAQQLPPEWLYELERLQSNVPPFPYEVAREILIRELKDTPENLFASFETEPFAAASTAQVHKATLHDGTVVVVKVQRPNIDVTVKADLNVMRDLTKRIQRKQEWAQAIDLRSLVNEFADAILYELDYRNEAANISLLTRNMAQFDAIHVPTVYSDLSTSKVLTMEFIAGVKINNVERIKAAGIDCQALARQFVHAMTKQALFDGFFHADPHPGNVLVDLETGRIGFLDMGLMGELNRTQRMALADLLVSMVERDGYNLGKAALHLSRPLPGRVIDDAEFLEMMDRFGQRFLGDQDADLGYTVNALQDVLRRSGLRLDPNFTLVFKTLMQADEIVRGLDPQIMLSNAAVESSLTLAREELNSEALAKTVRTQISRSSREVFYRIPSLVEATTKWLDQYEKGRLSVHVDLSDVSRDVDKLDKALKKGMDQLVLGLLLTGWLVGAAIAATVEIQVGTFRLSDLAFYMFMAGTIVSAYVVFQIIRRFNKDEDENP
ncbi:MAG: phage holin family protein [Ardenticatenaceae bacterium]|nr:phage holin family protein [Ardenticatenaceae bacterium]MCB8987181.1 phage holin family protein [Ardenticatenaceae bacterium]